MVQAHKKINTGCPCLGLKLRSCRFYHVLCFTVQPEVDLLNLALA